MSLEHRRCRDIIDTISTLERGVFKSVPSLICEHAAANVGIRPRSVPSILRSYIFYYFSVRRTTFQTLETVAQATVEYQEKGRMRTNFKKNSWQTE